MLRTLQYNSESNTLSNISINDMNFDDFKWVDCYNPLPEDLELIRSITSLPSKELERCVDDNERPSITDFENFTIIILKGAYGLNNYFSTTSIALIVSEKLVITIRKKPLVEIDNVFNASFDDQIKLFSKGSPFLVYRLIKELNDKYFSVLENIEQEIEIINEDVFNKPKTVTVRKIFDFKRTLIFFHKSLSYNKEVIANIVDNFSDKLLSTKNNNFKYFLTDLVQLMDMSTTYREILNESLEIYLSSVSNNMNEIMKKMTAFGSLVLVPTMITGLYGMNFKFMPEISWKFGYLFAWGLIIVSIFGLVIYFKKKDWF